MIRHMDLYKLRLTSYPFSPPYSDSNVVDAINEAFDGKVADGEGVI